MPNLEICYRCYQEIELVMENLKMGVFIDLLPMLPRFHKPLEKPNYFRFFKSLQKVGNIGNKCKNQFGIIPPNRGKIKEVEKV